MTGQGFNSQKQESDLNRALIDYASEKYPDAVLSWIRGELASGKYLVLPSWLYKQVIPLLRDKGWKEEDLRNIYESKFLSAHDR